MTKKTKAEKNVFAYDALLELGKIVGVANADSPINLLEEEIEKELRRGGEAYQDNLRLREGIEEMDRELDRVKDLVLLMINATTGIKSQTWTNTTARKILEILKEIAA